MGHKKIVRLRITERFCYGEGIGVGAPRIWSLNLNTVFSPRPRRLTTGHLIVLFSKNPLLSAHINWRRLSKTSLTVTLVKSIHDLGFCKVSVQSMIWPGLKFPVQFLSSVG